MASTTVVAGRWNSIPSVIVVDIFSRLSIKDRLNASSTCSAWRECLFYPSLWPKVTLKVNSCSRPKRILCNKNAGLGRHRRDFNSETECSTEGAHFLVNRCGRFVRDVTIEFNSRNSRDVQDCADILEVLTCNANLQSLTLKPTSCRLEWSDADCRQEAPVPEEYVSLLLRIVRGSQRLHHLSFGCLEELLDHAECILVFLGQRQGQWLRSLHMASVKDDPDHYPLLDIPHSLFEPFRNLQVLSLDYDYMCDDLLHVLAKPNRCPLQRLSVHVHGIDAEHGGTSDSAWHQLRSHSPALEITLTLLHSNDPANVLQSILHPSMPLVDFRSYFSEGVDGLFLDRLASLSGHCLRSLSLVESLGGQERTPIGNLMATGQEDPLVMLAWRCKKLSSLTVIGYEICDADLIAIARLRGPQLKKLLVPACCICLFGMAPTGEPYSMQRPLYLDRARLLRSSFLEEMSNSLGHHWAPLELRDLPPSVANANMEPEAAYLPTLLGDQVFT